MEGIIKKRFRGFAEWATFLRSSFHLDPISVEGDFLMTHLRPALLLSLTFVFAGLLFASSANAASLAANAPEELKACCYEPCFTYRNHKFLTRNVCKCRCECECKCEPPVKAVLTVIDPRCCCTVDVPVCIPACCEGEPKICGRCTAFGHAVVEYKWCCGYRIKMVFGKCGAVNVHYYGLK